MDTSGEELSGCFTIRYETEILYHDDEYNDSQQLVQNVEKALQKHANECSVCSLCYVKVYILEQALIVQWLAD